MITNLGKRAVDGAISQRYGYGYLRCLPKSAELRMKAMLLKGLDAPLESAQAPDPVPNEGEVVVKVMSAALNKRDYWITKGKYPGLTFPLVLGSDGVGRVGNMDVTINPSLDWGEDNRFFGPDFRILGMPEYGTLAEYVCIPESNLYDKP